MSILKNSFFNTGRQMKYLVSINTPSMLATTAEVSFLNRWIRNENMQLKVLELDFFRICSTKKKKIFRIEKRRKRPRKNCI